MNNEKIKDYWAKRLFECGEVTGGKNEKKENYRRDIVCSRLKGMQKYNNISPNLGMMMDYGCGHCRFLDYLSFDRYVGVDLIPSIVEHNKSKYKKRDNVSFFNFDKIMDVESKYKNYFSKSFDSIFVVTVLQHILSVKKLDKIAYYFNKWLKRGGMLIVVENVNFFAYQIENDYIIFRSFDEYDKLFRRNGFDLIDYAFFSLFPKEEIHFMGIFKKKGD